MNKFEEIFRQDRRLTILKMLAGASGYQANQYLLHMALPDMGHDVSEDVIRGDLDWLAEQGLVTVRELDGGLVVAKLSKRGDDVQSGRATCTGVKRPRPD